MIRGFEGRGKLAEILPMSKQKCFSSDRNVSGTQSLLNYSLKPVKSYNAHQIAVVKSYPEGTLFRDC